jgi:hypothetical protein
VSLLGIDGHLVKESLLHLGTGLLVEGEVACHLGADGLDVALAGSLLSRDLLLDVGEVVGQAHAAIGSVGEHGSDLLDILGGDGSGTTNAVDGLGGSEDGLLDIRAVSRDVHHGAANGKRAHQAHGNTGSGLLHLL